MARKDQKNQAKGKPAPKTDMLITLLWRILLLLFLFCFLYQSLAKPEKETSKKPVKKEKGFTLPSWFAGTYQNKKEDHLKKESPLGKKTTKFKVQLDYKLFHQLSLKEFVIGKDDYMINVGNIKSAFGMDFVGENIISEKLRKLKVIQDTLKRRGIALLTVYAPGKGVFNPEKIPAKYLKYHQHTTNYELYVKKSKELNLNFIDLQAHFLKLKSQSQYPLFAPYAHHWTYYGECLAADTVIKTLEGLTHKNMPHITWSNISYPSKPKARDADILGKTKLEVKDSTGGVSLAYPTVAFTQGGDIAPLKVLGIGDSYYRGFLYTGVMTYSFAGGEFWYYYSKIFPDSDKKLKEVWEVDLKQKIEENKAIILLYSDAGLIEFGSGFIEDAYLLYTDPSAFNKLVKERTPLKMLKKQVHENPDLLDEAAVMSEELRIPVDSAVIIIALRYIKK